MYHHVATMAENEKKGVEAAGGIAHIYQVAETLPQDVLTKMGAPPKPKYPIISVEVLAEYDAFLFGIPTRFGSFPAQFKTFWDATGGHWAKGTLHGKPFGMFVSTSSPGGGQELTVMNCLSSMVHHGMPFIPLGYGTAFPQLTNVQELHGGSPWGAGCFAGADGSRKPSKLELEVAEIQGKSFYQTISKF